MPKNDRDLILWNLLKFLCVKAKLKIVRFGDSNLVTGFSGLTFAAASVQSLRAETTFLRLFLTFFKH